MFNEVRLDQLLWLCMDVYVASTLHWYGCGLALDCPLVNLLSGL